MRKSVPPFDVVVCGGGLAGFCAAVAAARLGARTCLVHDRPVFGGNSSSEVRVTPHGAANFHAFSRETGIISELLIEERARNHERILETGWTNSVWDMVLYDLATRTEGLTFFLNTSIVGVTMRGGPDLITESPEPSVALGYAHRPACATSREIESVTARVANQETEMVLGARTFIDCTGDGVIAHLSGCEWRMGSEGREEFGEPHAPEKPSRDTMGNSLLIRCRDIGRPCPFDPPAWAVKYENPEFFYQQGRVPDNLEGGYWWIEIGIPWNTLHENEDIRHELTRHALGIWHWMKNVDPVFREKCANHALDWIGQVPGKRETRRIIGRYFMTEHDPIAKTVFPDEVAYGGWFVDLHTPGGLLAGTSEPGSAEGYVETSAHAVKSYVGPYGIPLRTLIAKDVDNLFLAGRNISVTHAALGTVRVMATTALMGQAVGTAAALARQQDRLPGDLRPEDVRAIQQQLLRDGCFLPNVAHEDPRDLARRARVTASSAQVVAEAPPAEGLSADTLARRRGQPIALGGNRIDQLALCLTNLTATAQETPVRLTAISSLWDYRAEPAAPLAETTLLVPPGGPHWIPWPVRLNGSSLRPRSWVRVDVGPSEHIRWEESADLLPGYVAMYDIGQGKMRRYLNGTTMSFQIAPAQPVMEPENVLSGESRPHRYTNLWRSDASRPLPAWIALEWDEPVSIGSVELTFPGQLEYRYHLYPPFFRDPQTARDYRLIGEGPGTETVLAEVTGNYQARRVHAVTSPGSFTGLRLEVLATNGAPYASVYEIRVYPREEAARRSWKHLKCTKPMFDRD